MANILVQLAETASRALGLSKIGVRIPFLATDFKSLVIKDSASNVYNFQSSEYIALPSNNYTAEIGLNNPNLSSSTLYDALTELASRSQIGAMTYQGVWDASTNTPTLPTADILNKGFVWKVSVAGSTNISGITDWKVGDFAVSNGASYDKWDNTDDFSNVQPLNSNLTELSSLSGSSGLIRRTGSSYVYDNSAYITATALSGYIAKDGSTATTAVIPFTQGLSSALGMSITTAFGDGSALKIPDGSWIRPQTVGGGIGITSGSTLSGANSLYLSSAGWKTYGIPAGTIASGKNLGLDSNDNIVTQEVSGGITPSGHTQLTQPWSIGNGATEGASSIGIEMRSNQLLLGNVGVYNPDPADSSVQIVDQGLTIVGSSASFSKKIPSAATGVIYDFSGLKGYDSASNYVPYSAIGTRFDVNTAGAYAGSMVLQYSQGGSLVDGLILNNSGATFDKNVIASTTPTLGSHLINKTFGDSTYGRLASSNTFTGGNNVFQSAGSVTQIQTTNTATLQANFVLKRGDGTGTNWLLCTVGDASNGVTDFVIRHNTFGNVLTLGDTGNATFDQSVSCKQLGGANQTSATTTGAITYTLTSGSNIYLTGALTGAVTFNITAPLVGSESLVYFTQGATAQTLTLSMASVVFKQTNGSTGTGTGTYAVSGITNVNGNYCIRIFWATETLAYVSIT